MSSRGIRLGIAGCALALVVCARGGPAPERDAQAPASAAAADDVRLVEGLGDHHRPISTRSPEAQRYFDQGLALVYAFHHEAAVRSFREALRLDPECAMCAWGVAYALGPNVNAEMGPDAAREAWAAVELARRLAPSASAGEREWIDAVALRYAPEPPPDGRASLDRAFADAMVALARRHPDDPDAAVIAAESIMDLSPWSYWTPDGEPKAETRTAVELLERVLARDPTHLGANHYLIHAMEEHAPERALASAERLAALAPAAGHLVHMPSHIFWRVGRYEDALEINQRAAAADEAWFAWCGGRGLYAALYYPHNIHFLYASAAAEGRGDLTLSSARRLVAQIPASMLASFPPVEEFVVMPTFAMLRFGRYDALLGQPKPPATQRYATGIWHYARGIAHARRGESDGAAAELAALRAVAGEPALRELVFSWVPASDYLHVAERHLAGELAASRGDSRAAVAALAEAVAAQDAMQYTEPPRWWLPLRQAQGAVLLEAGRASEAEAVYREDLRRNPKNGWSLFGLAQSLRAQGRGAEAAAVESGFRNAWARADVELRASRL